MIFIIFPNQLYYDIKFDDTIKKNIYSKMT